MTYTDTEESPHANTILYHPRTKFEFEELERVGKTLIQQDILEPLPDRPVEIVADLHLHPYYGEENESKEEPYSSLAKAGMTTYHGYATLCARVRNKRALAVSPSSRRRTAKPHASRSMIPSDHNIMDRTK